MPLQRSGLLRAGHGEGLVETGFRMGHVGMREVQEQRALQPVPFGLPQAPVGCGHQRSCLGKDPLGRICLTTRQVQALLTEFAGDVQLRLGTIKLHQPPECLAVLHWFPDLLAQRLSSVVGVAHFRRCHAPAHDQHPPRSSCKVSSCRIRSGLSGSVASSSRPPGGPPCRRCSSASQKRSKFVAVSRSASSITCKPSAL
jgi:hypothetical protein